MSRNESSKTDHDRTPSLPAAAFCLRVPDTQEEELVVHRDNATDENYVFLFEAGDDAADYARDAGATLGFVPEIVRVRLCDLNFKVTRFKPALGPQVDLLLEV